MQMITIIICEVNHDRLIRRTAGHIQLARGGFQKMLPESNNHSAISGAGYVAIQYRVLL
jgi:hypothetical protein